MVKFTKKNNISCINNKYSKPKNKIKHNLGKETVKMIKNLESLFVDEEAVAFCPECGTPHETIRPGKTQPVCICHLICDICGGRKAYHFVGEDPNYPNMSGEWCSECGPFEILS